MYGNLYVPIILMYMRTIHQERMEDETSEDRERRLHRLRIYSQQRVDNETPEEREANLHRFRINSQQRMDNDSRHQKRERPVCIS